MFIFLLPPSEGKNVGGVETMMSRTFDLSLPIQIATSATPKDLKCKGERYEKGMEWNRNVVGGELLVLPAIDRYVGVMYKAIGYESMGGSAQECFDEHVLILSGMYGLLKPQDLIANYKLPIDTKGLRKWWGDRVTQKLVGYIKKDLAYMFAETQHKQPICADVFVIDLLSGAYQKMLDLQNISETGVKYMRVEFVREVDGELKKYTHGVKKVKGEWLQEKMEILGAGGLKNADIEKLLGGELVGDGVLRVVA